MRKRSRLVALLAAAAASPAAFAAPASAAQSLQTAVSSNWAGYAVAGQSFASVSGGWIQPAASCTSGTPSYSAFWVGLGGFSADSQALEQIGTAVDCSVDGVPASYAWFELVPAAPVSLQLRILPGDAVWASVKVAGRKVSLLLRDMTRKTRFSKQLTMAAPDLSSAEWIAESPSTCDSSGRCRPLPLANFGTVSFAGATATAGGHAGTISDPAWSATAVQLQSDLGGFDPGPGPVAASPPSGADPAGLSADGTSFSIAWRPRP